MVEEVWKDVFGYEGDYQVSNLGAVRSLKGGRIKPLSPFIGAKRYLQVALSKKSKVVKRYVHHLVIEAFHGPRPSLKMDACHNDGNSLNNCASNLRWDTRKGNFSDKKLHGTSNTGSKNGASKLTDEQVLEIRDKLSKGVLQKEISRQYNIHKVWVSEIKNRRTWTHI